MAKQPGRGCPGADYSGVFDASYDIRFSTTSALVAEALCALTRFPLLILFGCLAWRSFTISCLAFRVVAVSILPFLVPFPSI